MQKPSAHSITWLLMLLTARTMAFSLHHHRAPPALLRVSPTTISQQRLARMHRGAMQMGLMSPMLAKAGVVLVAGGRAVGSQCNNAPLWHNEMWVLTSFILLLGVTYEKLEHLIKHSVPRTFAPAVNAMFGELAALGFIATATFVITHPMGASASIFQNILQAGAAALGTSFSHMLHDYETIHFGLFFIVNFYFLQNLLVVLVVVATHSPLNAAKIMGADMTDGPVMSGVRTRMQAGDNDWEDQGSRMGLLRAMAYQTKSQLLQSKSGDLPPSEGYFPGFSTPRLMIREALKGWRSRMSDLLLFREAARLRLQLAAGVTRSDFDKSQASSPVNGGVEMRGVGRQPLSQDRRLNPKISVAGLDFLEYMECSVASVMAELVHISATGWLTVWLSLTGFLTAVHCMQATGCPAAIAQVWAYAIAQTLMLALATCLSAFLTYIKEMLRPRLSEAALALLEREAGRPEGLDSPPTQAENETKVGRKEEAGEVVGAMRLWDSRGILVDPPYKALPGCEAPNGVRDAVRRTLGWKAPRNQHEQLFGWLGASGPRILAFLIQVMFFGSTILLMTNVALIDWAAVSSIKGAAVLRCACVLPSVMIILLMPGIIVKFNYAVSTEELTKTSLLKRVIAQARRTQFAKALRSLVSLTMLFRDDKNNITQKVALLQSSSPPPRRDAAQESLMLSRYSSEELGLLEAAFLNAVTTRLDVGHVLRDALELQTVFRDLSVSLSPREAQVLFDFMDRDGNAAVDFHEFAAVMLLPVLGSEHEDSGSGPAVAQGDAAATAVDGLFSILDVNKDGLVTLDEFQAVLARVFPSWKPDALVPLFREIDEDQTGSVSYPELLAFTRSAFARGLVY